MTSDYRPKYGHVFGGHLLLGMTVSFPVSFLIAWLGLRVIAHVAFDAAELGVVLAITWIAVSLIDSRLDYELQRAANRTAPPMPWPMVVAKALIPFALPWPTVLLREDVAIVAAASIAAGAVRLVEIIGLEQPWKGEEESVVERRAGELRRLNRETLGEIREERRTRAGRPDDAKTYDPYNLRGKR
ncbi:hypothetical protein G1C96_1341 [Bifidobacterium sp. DSM 109958]|uniref:Uncharacterized protein n=1 Tax=Bifidobacterium moraviense TaxID=2675323 RepID=A0A7Y0F2E6_9BIFI|nr:hypothetical protein [Bifidobacterium sp. DSM 109958]NMN00762.1 hypothetical protein [Bifidobacterium sp. DSM 109958]